ncbi:unnamed protein product [Paramecium octaurelia]|uniref:Glutathione S-transferase n=1 Tax=Paramecium octaurelia TaxID=43137 RepID=A0A8S1T5L7_PAROT|nr:unnamed protein product [Paramecium octaurelia]
MSNTLTLYYNPISMPSRAVLTLLTLGNVPHTAKVVDLQKQENLTPEYTAINPCQGVPALDDDGFKLFESHAILRYIVNKYQLHDFYPKDPQEIAKVECYLDWHHTGTKLVSKFVFDHIIGPKMMGRPAPPDFEAKEKEMESILQFIEYVFLGQGKFKYVQNQPKMTIADLALIFEIQMLFGFNYSFDKFPGLKNYVQHMSQVPQIKQANQAFFGMIKNAPLNDFIKGLIQ